MHKTTGLPAQINWYVILQRKYKENTTLQLQNLRIL